MQGFAPCVCYSEDAIREELLRDDGDKGTVKIDVFNWKSAESEWEFQAKEWVNIYSFKSMINLREIQSLRTAVILSSLSERPFQLNYESRGIFDYEVEFLKLV